MAHVKCFKCGNEWETRQKSGGHPKWCPSCKNPNWNSLAKKKEYNFEIDTVKINLSDETLMALLMRRQNGESFASAVDRLLEVPDLHMSLLYDYEKRGKAVKTSCSIRVSKAAHEKLGEIKKENKIKRIDEVLFRIIHNKTNQKLTCKH